MTVTPTAPASNLSAQVAKRIRGLMGEQNVSGAALARALGVSQMWVSDRVRSAKTPIDVNDLDRIAGILHADPVEILRTAASTTDRYPVGAHAVDVRSPRTPGTRSRFRQAVAA